MITIILIADFLHSAPKAFWNRCLVRLPEIPSSTMLSPDGADGGSCGSSTAAGIAHGCVSDFGISAITDSYSCQGLPGPGNISWFKDGRHLLSKVVLVIFLRIQENTYNHGNLFLNETKNAL